MFHYLLLAVTLEIKGSKIARFESRRLINRAGQAALVEWYARQYSYVQLLRQRQQIPLWSLIENVVDHLNGIYQPGSHDVQRGVWLVIVDRHPHSPHFSAFLQVFESAAPLIAAGPIRIPDMQLLQVDRLQLQISQARFRAADDVLVRKYLFDADARTGGPQLILRRNFRGHVKFVIGLTDDLPYQLFAMAFPIRERCIDEIQT